MPEGLVSMVLLYPPLLWVPALGREFSLHSLTRPPVAAVAGACYPVLARLVVGVEGWQWGSLLFCFSLSLEQALGSRSWKWGFPQDPDFLPITGGPMVWAQDHVLPLLSE